MPKQTILSCNKISKHFDKVVALKDLDLQIGQGEIFGLLGPNGAGKTTLLRCLMGFIQPSSGSITLKGELLRLQEIIKYFGFLPENFQPPANLTANELLYILGWGLNLRTERVDACLNQVGLKEHKDKLIKAFSRGMIQRLGLALTLLKDPEVIILDEPTLGLDPIGQVQIWELLVSLNQQGKTVFFSSHILSHIEKVCQRIGIIHQGKLRFTGSTAEFMHRHNSPYLEEAFLKEVS